MPIRTSATTPLDDYERPKGGAEAITRLERRPGGPHSVACLGVVGSHL